MIEVICLATIVFNEARSESDDAQIGVAHVVMNNHHDPCKAKSPQFHVAEVVPDRLNKIDLNAWSNALVIAKMVMDCQIPDPTHGARHFTNAYTVPEWAKSGMTVYPIDGMWFWLQDSDSDSTSYCGGQYD